MKLFLIRHAEAIDYETESVRGDENRFITPKGRKLAQTVFRNLREDLADLDKIFTSPLIRAVQTAEILAVSLKYKHDVEIVNELLISSPVQKLAQLIKRNTVFSSLALVGHEPMLGMLVEHISDRKTLDFQFHKSGVCYIEYDSKKHTGEFKWYYNPKTSEFIK